MSSQTHAHYENLDTAISGTDAPSEVTDRLSLVSVDFLGFDGVRKTGQIVVASVLADEVQIIFGRILDAEFPIESVIPIVRFGWDDHRSIDANNTSAFNYRLVPGTDDEVRSMHSHGRAIDINPRLNPYLYPEEIDPNSRYPYIHFDPDKAGSIVEGDAVVQAFDAFGWEWGGRWEEGPDRQHFEKPLE